MLQPSPLGSKFGFRYTSILALACSGNIKKYANGTKITTNSTAVIIYFLFIPATYSININATKNANAVPQSGCFIISNVGTATVANIIPSFQNLFISSLPFCCNFTITFAINNTTAILANSAGWNENGPILNQLVAPFIGSVNNTATSEIRLSPYITGDILANIS